MTTGGVIHTGKPDGWKRTLPIREAQADACASARCYLSMLVTIPILLKFSSAMNCTSHFMLFQTPLERVLAVLMHGIDYTQS